MHLRSAQDDRSEVREKRRSDGVESGFRLRHAGDGIAVELCWPYRAQQKGSVENLVGFVKSSFFKLGRFHDEEDPTSSCGIAAGR